MTDVLFGDIEEALIDRLDSVFAMNSYTVVPKGKTSDYLPFNVVQRLGGPTVSIVTEQATVTIETWAKTDKSAHDLNQLVRRAVHDLEGRTVNGLVFYRVQEFAGPARLRAQGDAVVTGAGSYPRFVFTVSITVRGISSS